MNPTSTSAEPLRIALLLGSVRTERMGGHVAAWVAEQATRVGEVDLIDLAAVDLPDDAHLSPGGGSPTALTQRLATADAFVVVTPEYNHAYPAALKRAIDWHFAEWSFKTAALVGYGPQTGGALAAEALRGVFAELRVVTVRRTVTLHDPWDQMDEHFTPDDQAARTLNGALNELAWWGDLLRQARRERPFTG